MSDVYPEPATAKVRAGALQIAGLLAANHVLTRVAPRLLPGADSSRIGSDWARFGEAAVGDFAQAIVALAIVPGVVEELVFRGLVFAFVRRAAGVRWAIVVSAVAFGAVHLDLHLSTIAALLGLQLGCLRSVHGLGLAIAAHVANNLLVLVLRFHDEAQLGLLPETSGGPIEIATTGLALVLAGMAWASLARSMREEPAGSAAPFAGADRTTDGP